MDDIERARQDRKNDNRRSKRASAGKKIRIREIRDSDASEEEKKAVKKAKVSKKEHVLKPKVLKAISKAPQSCSSNGLMDLNDTKVKANDRTENGIYKFEQQQDNINRQASNMLSDMVRENENSNIVHENMDIFQNEDAEDMTRQEGNGQSKMQGLLTLIEKEASEMLSMAMVQEEEVSKIITTEQSWKKRIVNMNSQWENCRNNYAKSRSDRECPAFKSCDSCFTRLEKYVVFCRSCKKELCTSCDSTLHAFAPFHSRSLYITSDMSSRKLLPVEIVDHLIQVQTRGVPVPCSVPSCCPSCFKIGTMSLIPGSKKKIVVTKDGRFDLDSAAICCSSTNCEYSKEYNEEEYVKSHWWPGTPSGSMYLFSEDVLEFWFHLKHQNLGSSERKFIETLNRISKAADRIAVIDRTLFNKASREYEFYVHVIDRDVRQQRKALCPTCGDDPKAACIDGNFRLPRLESASKGHGESLLKNEIISADADVNDHIKKIDKNIAPERNQNPCGANVFKAAKETSSSKKNLDETGLIMACCRHLIILQAVNMFVGESYRHAHYLHNFLYNAGYRIFCYDIVCLYWKWAEKVGKKIKRFSSLTKKMVAFLARFHAIAHVWHCYILWVGHWQKGVGATVGEEQEQVNASMSLYGNRTKHMTPENRNDTLSAGMMYLNTERFDRMPEFLSNRLAKSRVLAEAFTQELNELLIMRNLTELDLPEILERLKEKAKVSAQKRDDGPGPPSYLMNDLEGTYAEMQILIKKRETTATTAKDRSKLNKIIGASKKKARKLIDKINEWHHVQKSNENSENETADFITFEDFNDGIFPWQLSDKKDNFRNDMHLIETWMLSLRHKEEIEIVESEMVTYWMSLRRTVICLEKERENCQIILLDKKETSSSENNLRSLMAKSFIIFEEIRRLKKLLLRAYHAFRDDVIDDDLILSDCDDCDDDL